MTMQVIIVVLLSVLALVASSCDNSCSGHGTCSDNSVCNCYEGWGLGLSRDSGDCSQRICPFEFAWVDSPDRIGNHHKYVECSAKGICNRESGECECFPGYEGKACARTTCPNDCSGHGQCLYLDKEPFKTVIGDYNNYKKYVTFEEGVVSAVGSTFTSSPSLVADLLPNSKLALDGSIYWVKSLDTKTTFKLATSVGGTAYTAPTLSSVDVTCDAAGLCTGETGATVTDFFVNKEVVVGGITYYVKEFTDTGTGTFKVKQAVADTTAFVIPNTLFDGSNTADVFTASASFVATLAVGDKIKISSTPYWVSVKLSTTTFKLSSTDIAASTTAYEPASAGTPTFMRVLSASTYVGGLTNDAAGEYTCTQAFYANLVVGNPIVISDVTYFVKSKTSGDKFKVSTTGPTLYKPSADVDTDIDATTTRIVTMQATHTVGTITVAGTGAADQLTVNDPININGKIYYIKTKSGVAVTVSSTSGGTALGSVPNLPTAPATFEVSAAATTIAPVLTTAVTFRAATGIITAKTEFVSELVVGNPVTIGSEAYIYTVRSIESATTFTLNAVGAVYTSTAVALAAKLPARLVSTGTAFAPVDSRSFVITRGNNVLVASAIAHGLVVGDFVYLTGLVGTTAEQAAAQLSNYQLYKVSAVTDANQFAIRKVSGSVTSATFVTSALFTSTTVTCNVVKIKDIAQGQFDVVDPLIESLTTFIDRKYWDAKKTRACVCDPEYGDVDCSARMCQYGTDVMDSQKDQTVVAKNHVQLVSLTGETNYETAFSPYSADYTRGKSFALTFKTKVNETFSTIPINMPYLVTTTAPTTLANALIAIRNFELDVEWALKNLPSSVIDGVKVKVTKPVDTTGVSPGTDGNYPVTIPLSATNVAPSGGGSIGGTKAGHNVFEFSVEFTGNNVQGTQHYLTVEAAKCGNGCFPKINGLPIVSEIGGNTFITVTTKPTFSAGADNDYEADFNSYECGRRGKCDYKTGLCSCFSGYTGNSCNVITALV